MENIITLLAKNQTMMILTFFAFLIMLLFSILKKKLDVEMHMRELELKNAIIENTNLKKEDAIKKVISCIPEGVNEEEFFNRLKKELLEVSYIELKDEDKPSEENSLYKFLESHHRQALQQSSVQFWFSIFAASVGFIFIIIMICTSSGNAWYEYIVKVLPGTIIDAISVLFFNQAHETRDRAANFFKELTYEKQISKSVAIADAIEDKEIKATVQSKIALHIIGLKDDEITRNNAGD